MKRTKLTDKLKETIVELRTKGFSYSEIANAIGVSENTILNWLNKNNDLKKRLEEAENRRWDQIKNMAVDAIKQSLTQRQIVEYEIHKDAEGRIKRVVEFIKTLPPDSSTALKILEKLDKRFSQTENSVVAIQINLFPTPIPEQRNSDNVTNK